MKKHFYENSIGSLENYIKNHTNSSLLPPVKNWEVKLPEGFKICSVVDLFNSFPVQKELLKSSIDVFFIPNKNDVLVYLYLNNKILNIFKSGSFRKLYNAFVENKGILEFNEGTYILIGLIENGLPLKFGDKLEDFKEEITYTSVNDKIYETSLINTLRWSSGISYYIDNVYYKENKELKEFTPTFAEYINSNKIFDLVKDLCEIAKQSWLILWNKKEQDDIKAKKDREDAHKVKIQSYIDWVKEGNPVYYRYGFSYKGAKCKKISSEKAIEMIQNEQPSEYLWEEDDGEKILVLQFYGENDYL